MVNSARNETAPGGAFPTNLRDLVNDAILQGLSGEEVDVLVCYCGINFLDQTKPRPTLPIELSGALAFERFRHGFAGIVPRNGVPHVVSVYPPIPNGFPVARVYHLPVPDLLELDQIVRGFEAWGAKPRSRAEMRAAIGTEGYENRVSAYCVAFWERAAGFKGLAEGRLAGTFVKKSFVFSSKGCVRCRREAELLTTTFGDIDNTDRLMIGFYLCPEHAAEASTELRYITISVGFLAGPLQTWHGVCRSISWPTPPLRAYEPNWAVKSRPLIPGLSRYPGVIATMKNRT
jgi:hypothetical protein